MWQEGTGGKDFPVLCNSRSRYVERNDNNDDIPYSSKFLWFGMFVIEVINHVIMALLLEIRLSSHINAVVSWHYFYLQFVNSTIIGKTLLLAAGLFCFPRIFGRCSSFGNCKIRANGAMQTQAGNT